MINYKSWHKVCLVSQGTGLVISRTPGMMRMMSQPQRKRVMEYHLMPILNTKSGNSYSDSVYTKSYW